MNQARNKPLISIIVPVYMTERELPRCIESIIAQTYINIEVILINDGSPDKCGEICDSYARLDDRIHVIHKKNSGVSTARNAGLDAASGDYIGFIDSDDWVEPAMFETLLRPFLEGKTKDISICGFYRHIDGDILHSGGTLYVGQMSGREGLHRMIRGGCFDGYLWNKLFNASLFKDLNKNGEKNRLREDIYICEDLLMCCQIFTQSEKIYYNPQPIYHYIIREGSALRTYDAKRETEFVARREILQLTKEDKQLYNVAEFIYAQSLLNYAGAMLELGEIEKARCMQLEAIKFFFRAMFGNGVGIKAKLRLIAMYIAPNNSIKLWKRHAKRFGFIWTKPEDK